MYQERMMGYYPQAIQSILEFQAIINSEYPEIEDVSGGRERIISDAYLLTMSDERIKQWENALGIHALEGTSIEDRRNTIIARIRGQGKLNTALIKTIVKTFTGADCNTWIEDSTLYVRLLPPKDNKDYFIDNIIQEIKIKLPAHLGCEVTQAWQYWRNINSNYTDWDAVRTIYSNWEGVLFDSQDKPNRLDYSTLDSFHLG